MKEFGYYHGRFQPFHKGHLGLIQEALIYCNTLVIGISNPFRIKPIYDRPLNDDEKKSLEKARDTDNNPWPYWARVWIIREGLMEEDIDLSRIIFMPNLNNSHLPVKEVLFPKKVTLIFICPKESHNKMWLKRYKEENWDVHIVKNQESVSGSDIRERILKNTKWENLVPKGSVKTIKILQELI